jgi:D-alanyl-D-alanine carboxypeptidase/D-alanyl-D-alanine carboxypeptidase (penicillin-binding protein 5/6)
MDESPAQFTDTVTLFNSGFNTYKSVNVSDNDSRYMPDDSLFFESDNDVFGRSGTILKLSKNSQIILPKTQSIEDTDYEIQYDLTDLEKSQNPNAIARVAYSFSGSPIGTAYVCYSALSSGKEQPNVAQKGTVFINVKILIAIAVVILILSALIGSFVPSLNPGNKRSSNKSDRMRYKRRRKEFKKSKFKFK